MRGLTYQQLYDIYHSDKYDVWQNFDELWWLVSKLKNRKIKKVLEIGTHKGGSLKVWEQLVLSNVRSKSFKHDYYDIPNIISIDKDTSNLMWDTEKSKVKIDIIEKRSQNAYVLVNGYLGSVIEIDFLYIDGSHKYEDVKEDFKMYSLLVRKGGIIAINDIYPQEKGVHKAWNEIKQLKEFKLVGECIKWTGTGCLIKRR